MNYLGDFAASSTVRGMWNSNAVAGESITRATNGSLRIYKNNSTTERSSSAGITDTEDFDSLTGVHHYNIDLSDNTDPGFYAAGNDYFVVLSAATIDGKTINAVIGCFSIENRNIKANVTQFGGTNGTFSSGRPEVNTTHLAGTSQTARDIGASVLLSPGTGTGQVSLNSGAVSLHTSQPAVTFTSLTSTGAFTVSDGIIVSCSTSNRSAIDLSGNGTGHGIHAKGGTGATGNAIYAQARSTNGHGIIGTATGAFNGIYGYGGSGTGVGIKAQGGDTSGRAFEVISVSGDALYVQSGSGVGFQIISAGSNNSAIKLTPAGSGYGIEGTVQTVTTTTNLTTNNDKTGYALTSGERTSIANEVEAQIIDDTDSEKVLQAITDKIASVNPSLDDLTLGGIASAVRTELAVELARIDAAISSRLASASISLSAGAVTVGTNNDKTGYSLATTPPTAAAIVTAIRAMEIESGETYDQLLQRIRSILYGKVTGGGTSETVFYRSDGTTVAARVTADSSGNRSGVTFV